CDTQIEFSTTDFSGTPPPRSFRLSNGTVDALRLLAYSFGPRRKSFRLQYVRPSHFKSEDTKWNFPRHSNTLFWQTDFPMKQFFTKLRQTAIAGFFFLFPLYVVFIVISKAWTSLISIGSKLASMFGVKAVLGVGGATLFSSLLIIAIWLLCGLLVRVSFVGAFSRTLERTISSLIPGYDSYRAIAEEKIAHK